MSTPLILTLTRMPARLDTLQTAQYLGFQPHDIPILIHAKLLHPIGDPKPNAPKYFAAVDLEELAHDRSWLDKAQKAIQKHWLHKNQRNDSDNSNL